MKLTHPVLLKDALNNLLRDSGASDQYCNGLVVGVVSTLMACGYSYTDAITTVVANTRKDARLAMPECWLADFNAARSAAK